MSENVTNPNESVKSKREYVSINEWISRMKTVFSNAALPNIQEKLESVGYTAEKIQNLGEKLAELEQLSQKQKKEYAEQHSETVKFEQKRKEIDEVYRRHLAFCKILFKNDVKAATALEFAGKRKLAYSAWFQQVSNFYSQLLGTGEFLDKLKTINIKEADLKAMEQKLEEITALKNSQKKEASEAQKATENRDIAFDALYSEYSDLIAYAKILFSKEQDLEALGIVVKR